MVFPLEEVRIQFSLLGRKAPAQKAMDFLLNQVVFRAINQIDGIKINCGFGFCHKILSFLASLCLLFELHSTCDS
jgi:hypothetical protein